VSSDPLSLRGYTVRQIAARYRVGRAKVIGWINRRDLSAINTASVRCARPRFVVTPEALAAFERARQAGAPPTIPRRRRRATGFVDYFPD
jgi:transposase